LWRMQIDLEPKDYRADPLPGEPAVKPDALPRLMTLFAWLGLGLLVAVLLRPVASYLRDITWPW